MKQNLQIPSLMTRRSFATGSLAATATLLTGGNALAADDLLDRALAPRVIGDAAAPIHVAEY